jgi:glucose-6-phosphate isomerase
MKNIKFNFNLLHQTVIGENGIQYGLVKKHEDTVKKAMEKMKEFQNNGINFMSHPFICGQINHVLSYSKILKEKFKNMVIVGIGGSSLGTEALYTTFREKYADSFDKNSRKLYFIDNYDSRTVEYLVKNLDFDDTVFVVISKSGGTLETMAPFFYIKELILAKHDLDYLRERLVFVTDQENGQLNILNKELNVEKFIIPSNVGGRFSIFTPVGILAAKFVDIDITLMNNGVKDATNDFFDIDIEENDAVKYALIQAVYDMERDFNINAILFYNDRFVKFSQWFGQLWGESLGKPSKDGKKHFGTTPVFFRGSTDQHSQLQQFTEGKNDKIYTVISYKEEGEHVFKKPELEKFSYIEGYGFNDLLNAAKIGTVKSLIEKKRPVIEIEISKFTEYELGYFYQFFMLVTAFTGFIFDINPFDQPGVEKGKVYTIEELLKGKK